MTCRVGVIGAGAWGTALAHLMATKGCPVTLWAFEAEVAGEINASHENTTYLPKVVLPAILRGTNSLAEALDGAELVISVVPSHVLRGVISEAAPYLPQGVPIVSATKGIENGTLMTMSEVLEDVLPMVYHPMLTFLSGPSFAKEVVALQPTAVSVAARFERVAEQVQREVSSTYFRVYTTNDVVGVELGGALKNVIAIASGAAAGAGLGLNAMAGLITRGLAEINRLAIQRGANPLTLAGLSGMGDLVLTCTGGLSRNRTVGMKLGQGMKLDQIISEMRQVAEGVKTTRAAWELAQREGIDMPITETVYQTLYEDLPVMRALASLMGRPLKRELH
ncbi:MAG: NAD(P)-dependent glycerol-3-phosphate dehydrogenase [Proteobacteria bacterium]|jgi:glycerol-3-phosphate dehydrogenase (NAD(P)+)|nr:NAD(P)-dependent glycerol-3-phosphate dehydrogenase [Pseudomonadota bacterium]